MSAPSKELVAGLRKLLAAEERQQADALRRQVRTLENKVRRLVQQRDNAVGRCAELRAYVTKYQKELAELRRANKE